MTFEPQAPAPGGRRLTAFLTDPGAPVTLQPLTCTRGLADCPVAGERLLDLQRRRLAEAGCELAGPDAAGADLVVAGNAWISRESLARLLARAAGAAVLRAPGGEPLAWRGGHGPAVPAEAATVDATPADFALLFPWDLLRLNEELVGALAKDVIVGTVSPRATVTGHLVLGEGSVILPGVYLEGNAVIGRHTKVGPNAYLRGHTTIGDHCHIGQAVEIKNSLLFDHVAAGHLSYCGDSIIGARVNLGAGTITANFRHDGRTHRSLVDGELRDTGRRKFGAVLGDDVHTGIHTGIYPGRKLWPGVSTRPGTMVQHDLTAAGLYG